MPSSSAAHCPSKSASGSDRTSPSTGAVNHPLGDRSSGPSGPWCAQRNTRASRASCGGLEGLHGETRRGFCGGPALFHSLRRQRKRGYVEQHFCIRVVVGSALLALWIHVRFPKLAPEQVGRTMLHTGIAFALLRLVPGMVRVAGDRSDHDRSCSCVPALSYALLCSIWMLRHVQTAMGVWSAYVLGECQRVAGLDPAARALAASELDDRLGAAAAGSLPRRERRVRSRSRPGRGRGRSRRSRTA